jgi:integration host factor subunit alpha
MTITKDSIIKKIAEELNCSVQEATKYIDGILTEIAYSLKRGEMVLISGFGKFQIVNRIKRVGRNPITNQKLTLRPRKTVAFRTSPKLRDLLNPDTLSRRQKRNIAKKRGGLETHTVSEPVGDSSPIGPVAVPFKLVKTSDSLRENIAEEITTKPVKSGKDPIFSLVGEKKVEKSERVHKEIVSPKVEESLEEKTKDLKEEKSAPKTKEEKSEIESVVAQKDEVATKNAKGSKSAKSKPATKTEKPKAPKDKKKESKGAKNEKTATTKKTAKKDEPVKAIAKDKTDDEDLNLDKESFISNEPKGFMNDKIAEFSDDDDFDEYDDDEYDDEEESDDDDDDDDDFNGFS